MAGPRNKGGPRGKAPDAKPVVRRKAGPRRPVPPDVEALGRGERPPPRPRRPRLSDPRPVALVPGVKNRDARAVLDARLAVLREAMERYADDPEAEGILAEGLAEVFHRRMWRGRSLTSFEAFAEQVLGLEADEALRLRVEGARRLGLAEDVASDEAVAVALRIEAALLSEGIDGEVHLSGEVGSEQLQVSLRADQAPAATEAVARSLRILRDPGPEHRGRERDRGSRP